MKINDLLENSSWGKIDRRIRPKMTGYKKPSHKVVKAPGRIGHIPKALIPLAKAYGAYYDEEKQGWYVKGKVPYELIDAIKAYNR